MVELSVVIPVYNGEGTLETLIEEISQAIFMYSYEIILVDDCSPDGSKQVIEKLKGKYSQVVGYHLHQNLGQQTATLIGIQNSTGQYILTMDDDGQHDPKDILVLYEILKSGGYDLVYGIPEIKQHASYRKMGTVFTDWLFTVCLKKPSDLRISSFRILSRSLADSLNHLNQSFVYISALLLLQKPKVCHIHTRHRQRKVGQSNYTIAKLIGLYMKLLIYHVPCFKYLRRKSEPYIIEEIK